MSNTRMINITTSVIDITDLYGDLAEEGEEAGEGAAGQGGAAADELEDGGEDCLVGAGQLPGPRDHG